MIRVKCLLFLVGALLLPLAVALQAVGPALAAGMPGMPEAPAEKRFTIEVSRSGFKVVDGPVHQMRGQTHLAISQGDQVTITYVYADTDYEKNNPHRIAISRMRVDSGILDADNPRRTITFTARRDGESFFRCVKLCEGHKRLQDGKLMVQPVAGAIAPQPTKLVVDIPNEMVRGSDTALAAILNDASGNPVQDEPIRFLASTDFFVQDWMEVGQAMTDSSGVAVIKYRPAQKGDFQLMVSFPGDSAYLPNEVSSKIRLAGTARIYEPEAGIKLPSLGPQPAAYGGAPGFRVPPVAALALAVILIAIWSTYLLVVTQVYRISREP